MPGGFCHHLVVLTKWFRLKWSTRFAIGLPSFAMIGLALDLMDHATGTPPFVTLPVGVILISFLLSSGRDKGQTTGGR